MKKTIALMLALLMLCTASVALAEEDGKLEPLFATVGDALAAAGENPIAGGEEDYYAVITEQDGKYYRSVAELDEKAKALEQAIWEADVDHMEEAFAARDEYLKTLPIAYSEMFTVEPMTEAEMDDLVGQTIEELREAGYEDRESGTDGDENEELVIAYVLRNGYFEYRCVVDADFETYEKAQAGELDDGDFVVQAVQVRGITGDACFKRYRTDGTIEEPEDPFAGLDELTAEVLDMLQMVLAGEQVDVEAFFAELKTQYPNLVDSIDFYWEMYKLVGLERLASMLTPAE